MYLKQKLSPRSKRIENSAYKASGEIKKPKTYKVVVIGACGVGKSALTMQYVSNVFLDFHEPTIEDAFQTQTVVDGEPGVVDILDTAGQDDLETVMTEQYLRHGEAYIGVYSITDANSYHTLRKQIQNMKRIRNCEKIPLVIVANKLDMFNDRQISTLEGVALSREFDCPFYEASAANRINIGDAFNGLIRKIRASDEEETVKCKNNLKKPKLQRFRKFVSKKIQNQIII